MTQGNTPGTPHPAAMPFREALCALPCGFALYDPELRFVYVNEIMAAFNGVAVSDLDPATDILQAGLWGLGRSLAVEMPSLWGGLIDLDGDGDRSAEAKLKNGLTTAIKAEGTP